MGQSHRLLFHGCEIPELWLHLCRSPSLPAIGVLSNSYLSSAGSQGWLPCVSLIPVCRHKYFSWFNMVLKRLPLSSGGRSGSGRHLPQNPSSASVLIWTHVCCIVMRVDICCSLEHYAPELTVSTQPGLGPLYQTEPLSPAACSLGLFSDISASFTWLMLMKTIARGGEFGKFALTATENRSPISAQTPTVLKGAAVWPRHAPVWPPDPHWEELSAFLSWLQLRAGGVSICSKVEFCQKLNPRST